MIKAKKQKHLLLDGDFHIWNGGEGKPRPRADSIIDWVQNGAVPVYLLGKLKRKQCKKWELNRNTEIFEIEGTPLYALK